MAVTRKGQYWYSSAADKHYDSPEAAAHYDREARQMLEASTSTQADPLRYLRSGEDPNQDLFDRLSPQELKSLMQRLQAEAWGVPRIQVCTI